MSRRILILGGAPRMPVDAVRHLTVHATGTTAVALSQRLDGVDLLLSIDAKPEVDAQRYASRDELDAAVQAWLADYPEGVVVSSAAINDYAVTGVRAHTASGTRVYPVGEKVPSGAERLEILLEPAPKMIDNLRVWGHCGPLVAFKYQARAGVIAAAEALRERTGAALVVANSLCGSLQALVNAERVEEFVDRGALLEALRQHIADLAVG